MPKAERTLIFIVIFLNTKTNLNAQLRRTSKSDDGAWFII